MELHCMRAQQFLYFLPQIQISQFFSVRSFPSIVFPGSKSPLAVCKVMTICMYGNHGRLIHAFQSRYGTFQHHPVSGRVQHPLFFLHGMTIADQNILIPGFPGLSRRSGGCDNKSIYLFHLNPPIQLNQCVMPVGIASYRVDPHFYRIRLYVISFGGFWRNRLSFFVQKAPAVDCFFFWVFPDQVSGRVVVFCISIFRSLCWLCDILRKLLVSSFIVGSLKIHMPLCPKRSKDQVCRCFFCGKAVDQDVDMQPSVFPDFHPVNIFQLLAGFPVFRSGFPDHSVHIFSYFLYGWPITFFVG
nr:MAG TPA: hypothetical protein [Caudoviricetes sp.]